ncbi:MAG: hypothetical protein ACK5M7_00485 [Draconibacterium sp.]
MVQGIKKMLQDAPKAYRMARQVKGSIQFSHVSGVAVAFSTLIGSGTMKCCNMDLSLK